MITWYRSKPMSQRVLFLVALIAALVFAVPELMFQTATASGPLPGIPMPAATVDPGCSVNLSR